MSGRLTWGPGDLTEITPKDVVDTETMKNWTFQIMRGKGPTPEPVTPRERQIWEGLKRSVAEIEAAGLMVDIPGEVPP